MNIYRYRDIAKIVSASLVLCLAFVYFAFPLTASASALTALSDTMSRQGNGVASNHTIKFTSSTGAGDSTDTITVTMPAGFTIGTVDYTDIDLSHGASTGAETEETLATTASSSAWGASFTNQVLTLTHPTDGANGDITASDKVIIEIGTNASGGNAQITNHSTAATYTIAIAGDFGDTGSIAIVVVDDDQFTVTGTIDPTLTYSLDGVSTSLGVISASSPTTATPNIVVSISTNASSGYTVKIRDTGSTTNPGLYNASASAIIGSGDNSYNNSADLSSVSGYGIQAASASATIASPYNVSGNNIGGYEITDQNLATYSSTADSQTVTIITKAKASGSTPAGTYTDTVTVTVTGNF